MKTSYTKADRLRISLRWVWIGPVIGIVAMAVLFIAGLTTGSAPMTVIASSTAIGLGAVWVSTRTALKAQLVKLA